MPSFASSDPTFPLFPIFSFLGFLLPLIPLPWHFQAWNAGTCAFMIWTSTACLIEFINSLVWKGNLLNPAPIWCDISTKLLLGASVGIPAASLCISHRLYKIAAVQTVTVSRSDKIRSVVCDLSLTIGIPILIMILHTVVQGHRFDILEDIGCQPYIYVTLPAYFLYFMWPPLIGCISFVYCALTLRCFWKRRVMFNELMSSNTTLNTSRYMRLMALAIIEMLTTVPLGVWSMYFATKGVPLNPWVSWAETHYNFSRVGLIPAIYWRSDPNYVISQELTRWIFVASSLIFFGLFGFANEAQKNYALAFWRVAGIFGIKPAVSRNGTGMTGSKHAYKPNVSGGTLPSYVRRAPEAAPLPKKRRPDSLSSSLAGTDDEGEYELDNVDTTKDIDSDVEKSAGIPLSPAVSSIPPQYEDHDDAERGGIYHQPSLWSLHLQHQASASSVRSTPPVHDTHSTIPPLAVHVDTEVGHAL